MQRLTTCLMFVGEQHGRAEQAIELYVSAFDDSRVLEIERYGPGEQEAEGTVRRARFSVAGRELIAMDSGREHPFTFTPAISLCVDFDQAQQLEHAYSCLSADATVLMPLQEYDFSPYFAWLADRFGVSWQLKLEP